MNKTFLKKTLALILSVMLVLTALGGALAVSAEEESIIPGTVDGIDGPWYSQGRYVGPYASVMNNKFDEGLKYWSGAGAMTIDGVTYYSPAANGVTAGEGSAVWNTNLDYKGIESVTFTINDIKKGDELYLLIKYRGAEPSQFQGALQVLNKENIGTNTVGANDWSNKLTGSTFQAMNNVAADADGWKYAITPATQTCLIGDINETVFPDLSETYPSERYQYMDKAPNGQPVFYINLKSTALKGETMNGEISEVYVVRVVNEYTYDVVDSEDDILFDPPWVGTAAEGIKDAWYGVGRYVGVYDSFMNGSFDDGLKYWSGCNVGGINIDGKVSYAPAAHGVTNGNGSILFNTQKGYYGIESSLFYLDDIKTGDNLQLIIKYKGTTANTFQGTLGVFNNANVGSNTEGKNGWFNKLSGTVFQTMNNDEADAEGWKYAISPATQTCLVGDLSASLFPDTAAEHAAASRQYMFNAPNGAPAFYIDIKSNNAAVQAEIAEILIVRVVNAYEYDIVGSSNDLKFDPPWYGTEDEGLGLDGSKSWGRYVGVYDNLMNGDFAEGLKYWSGSNEVKVDNTPYYTPALNGVTKGNGTIVFNSSTNYRGVESSLFYLDDIKTGDKLQLLIKYKGTDANKFQGALNVYNNQNIGTNTAGANNWFNQLTGSTFQAMNHIAADADGWKYAITASTQTCLVGDINSTVFPDRTALDAGRQYMFNAPNGAPAFYINLKTNSLGGATINAEIDAVYVVRVVNDYSYDVVGSDEDINFDPPWYGTEEDGVGDTNWYSQAYYIGVYDNLMNGDFSEGLKYWSGAGLKNGSYSPAAHGVTKGDGSAVFATEKGYNGLQSSLFYLDDIKKGDNLQLLIRYKGTENPGEIQGALKVYNNQNIGTNTAGANNWFNKLTGTVFQDLNFAADENGWKYAITVGSQTCLVGDINSDVFPALNANGNYMFNAPNGAPAFCIDLKSNNAALNAEIDAVYVVRVVNNYKYDVVGSDADIEFDPTWIGTEEEGMSADNAAIHQNYNTGKYGFNNADFSDGLKYWGNSFNIVGGNAASTGSLVVDENGNKCYQFDGVARPDTYAGIMTCQILVSAQDAQADYFGVKFRFKGDISGLQVALRRALYGTATGDQLNVSISDNNGIKIIEEADENGWATAITTFQNPCTVSNTTVSQNGVVNDGDYSFYLVLAVKGGTKAKDENGQDILDEEGNPVYSTVYTCDAMIDDIQIVRSDNGGLGKNAVALDLDGNAAVPYEIGDANNDGKVDLVDLVRMKKYMINDTKPGISLIASDNDGVEGIAAGDLAIVIDKIIGKVA